MIGACKEEGVGAWPAPFSWKETRAAAGKLRLPNLWEKGVAALWRDE